MLWYCIFCTGFEVTQQLEEVAEHSNVLLGASHLRKKCQAVISDPLEFDINDFPHAFRYLKENI